MAFVAGIFDFSRIFFAYAQASQQLRTAVREAPVIGFEGGGLKPYLRCADMIDIAENVFFAENPRAVVIYYDAENFGSVIGPGGPNGCTQTTSTPPSSLQVKEDDLANGDYVVITSTGTVRPVFNTWIPWTFQYNFVGQRTIVKGFNIGSSDIALDKDYDGLLDEWEEFCYINKSAYNATDDPWGNNKNNGLYEYEAGSPPYVPADCPPGSPGS